MFGVTNVITILWPIWLFIGIVLVARIVLEVVLPALINRWRNKRRRVAGTKWRSDREVLNALRSQTPAQFEEYIATLFGKLGYKTKVTGGSHDQGVDVIAEKNGIEHYIQCKKFITSTVHVGAVRDFYGAIADHLTKGKAFFITTNKFTLEAEKFADDKPIELIDGYRLLEYIHLAEKEQLATGENIGNESICPECGAVLVQREGKFGKFLGCSKYPNCKFTKSYMAG
jgi:restriction system protein